MITMITHWYHLIPVFTILNIVYLWIQNKICYHSNVICKQCNINASVQFNSKSAPVTADIFICSLCYFKEHGSRLPNNIFYYVQNQLGSGTQVSHWSEQHCRFKWNMISYVCVCLADSSPPDVTISHQSDRLAESVQGLVKCITCEHCVSVTACLTNVDFTFVCQTVYSAVCIRDTVRHLPQSIQLFHEISQGFSEDLHQIASIISRVVSLLFLINLPLWLIQIVVWPSHEF